MKQLHPRDQWHQRVSKALPVSWAPEKRYELIERARISIQVWREAAERMKPYPGTECLISEVYKLQGALNRAEATLRKTGLTPDNLTDSGSDALQWAGARAALDYRHIIEHASEGLKEWKQTWQRPPQSGRPHKFSTLLLVDLELLYRQIAGHRRFFAVFLAALEKHDYLLRGITDDKLPKLSADTLKSCRKGSN